MDLPIITRANSFKEKNVAKLDNCEQQYQAYNWVSLNVRTGRLPSGALRAGMDADGSEIYAGRATHEGDCLPAKVIPDKSAAYVCYSGEEIFKEEVQVLVPCKFTWVPCSGGAAPAHAVSGGATVTGEILYLGRTTHDDGVVTVGKTSIILMGVKKGASLSDVSTVHPSHGCLYYPYDGQERRAEEYECLVLV